MEEKKEIITDDEFKMIFSYKRLRELLLINSASYPLIYHFMNYFITNQAYKKRESSSPKEGLGSIKFDNITTHLTRSLFCIKSSLEKNETFEKGLDILFFSRDRFIELNTENGEIKSDYLFWPIIHKIKKGHLDCRMALVSTPFKSVPNIDDIRLYSLIQYSTPLVLLRSLLFGTRIYLKWRLDRSQIINYLKDNDGEYLISLFDNFFSLRIFYSLIRDYSLKKVLKKTKPKVIMSNDDVITLKPRKDMENTKFIIMQSASIDEMKEEYKKMFLSSFPLDKLIADYFLVSGTKFKDLKKNTKDSKEIIVTGQPRYDILSHADKIYDKNKIFKQLNLDSSKKMILWTTQTHGFPLDENKKNIFVVYNVVKSLKNVQLVIKLHPAEDQNASQYKKDKPFEPVIIGGKADTYGLLYACDLMITRHSTTAMEAVALNKPVIILNLSGEPDPVDYVKEGVALGVYKEEDLKPAIEKLLKDDSELAKNRGRYIEKYLYKIDGKATERVVNLIMQRIEESRRKKELRNEGVKDDYKY
jgi:CDP-glycerol glycerophosphotransferase (TagB/SpsB family)